jgi:succinyl-diaminopimelate desuccinylase
VSAALDLSRELIARRSVTPEDAGCQALLASRLAKAGFRCEDASVNGVTNLWARRGSGRPLLCFAGHTDVVPTGPLEQWHSDPFVPTVRDGKLYGRGAADMKSSIAAFVVAAEQFVAERPSHAGSIALLLTSDEEGPAAKLTVRGVQGHVAYPEQVRNAIHLLAPALAELAATAWDRGNESFPPTSFQVSNLNAGTGVENVAPGTAVMLCNFRFSTASTEGSLRSRFEDILRKHRLDYEVTWALGGKPFLSAKGRLREAVLRSLQAHAGCVPQLSTAGGTSDGRFIIDICPEVLELGPVNASIHKLNEHIELGALEQLPKIYLDTLRALLP